MPTPSAEAALAHLRDGGDFQWYVIPLFVLVLYVYACEVERRNWSVLFAGLAFWGMDWFNEIWNALLFRATGVAPAWGAPGDTAFLILIGLNVEISLMFAVLGVAAAKVLPADPRQRLLGLPNRLTLAIAGSILAVLIEIGLNAAGALTWDWPWWSVRAPWLIFLLGYLPFFLVAYWVHDMPSLGRKAATVGVIYGVDLAAVLLFGVGLGWL